MKSASDIVLKILSLLLLTGAVLKGWQLLTEPMANNGIWTNRVFLILTGEIEIALGVWLLSGLFKKVAWLIALGCFTLFSFITLYKGLSGAQSCGCFGSVHVNPWITLFAIDIPAVILLSVFRPGISLADRPESIKTLIQRILTPLPSIPRFTTTVSVGLAILAVAGCVLAFNKPAKVTGGYEVLEPEEWIGKKLPIIEDIDISKELKKGTWLVLFFHYDCPDCITAIREYQRNASDLAGNEDFLKIAFVEVPPYGRSVANNNSTHTIGKLSDIKEWFITTPAVVLLDDSMVRNSWEEKAPDLDAVLNSFAKFNKSSTSKSGPEKEVIKKNKMVKVKSCCVVSIKSLVPTEAGTKTLFSPKRGTES
jgi:thiol-disulfide isomerase/thioredoxin